MRKTQPIANHGAVLERAEGDCKFVLGRGWGTTNLEGLKVSIRCYISLRSESEVEREVTASHHKVNIVLHLLYLLV